MLTDDVMITAMKVKQHFTVNVTDSEYHLRRNNEETTSEHDTLVTLTISIPEVPGLNTGKEPTNLLQFLVFSTYDLPVKCRDNTFKYATTASFNIPTSSPIKIQ
jgi:hypothetical protein